jgi:ankyrin repeat protein
LLISVQDIGHLRRLLDNLKELIFDQGIRDDDLNILLAALGVSLKVACTKGQTKVKCLVAQKDYASAALLQACITRVCKSPLHGQRLDITDVESSREIASARGDISEALDLQWIILEHLVENDWNIGSNLKPAFEKILHLTEISRDQVSRVAKTYELDVDKCVQLNHPCYKVLRLASGRWIPAILDLAIMSQFVEDRSGAAIMHPIRVTVRQDDDTGLKILLNYGIGVKFVESWRPSFEITGPDFSTFGDWPAGWVRASSESLPITHGSILHYAVAFKSEGFALALLTSKVSLGPDDDRGETPFHVAVLIPRPRMIELLLSKGADVNATNSRGRTPYEDLLDCLEFYYDIEEVDAFDLALKMVDKGANINAVSHENHSLLYLAMQEGCAEPTVRSILERKASVHDEENWASGYDSLVHAAWKGRYALVKVLLDHDIKTYDFTNINLVVHWENLHKTIEEQTRDDLEAYSLLGFEMEQMWFVAACTAAEKGHRRVVKLFLKYGIPVNFFNQDGDTLLLCATKGVDEKEKGEDVMRMLLNMGARVNARKICGQTPLTYPVIQGWETVVDLLLFHGVDVNLTDGKGQTALHLAVTHRPLDKSVDSRRNRVAQRLLSYGSQVNLQDNDGNTALHLAARLGAWSLLELILKACKDSSSPIDPVNHTGQTPLDLCNEISTLARFRAWIKGIGSSDLPVGRDGQVLEMINSSEVESESEPEADSEFEMEFGLESDSKFESELGPFGSTGEEPETAETLPACFLSASFLASAGGEEEVG